MIIDGKQLPPPDPKFGGVINERATESKPWWPPRVVPPKGAPNILLIMTEDSGYGASSTFGGVIPTPALDRIAAIGEAPSILNASYNFKAEIEVPQGGAEGMLITHGGRFAGYGFYLLKGKPVFL